MASGALRSSHVKLLKVSKVKLKHSESEVGYSEVAAFSYYVSMEAYRYSFYFMYAF